MRRSLLLGGLAALALLPGRPAWSDDDDDDHEMARRAVEAGRIKPLVQILALIEQRYVGQVVETDLDRDDGRWTYSFKLLPPSGRMFRLEVDAATGAVLKTKGPVQERR